jgi:hypothetical protein
MTDILAIVEVRRLTGCAWASTQAAWLKARGIPHKLEGNRVIVLAPHVRAWVEGKPVVSSNGPNWGAVA